MLPGQSDGSIHRVEVPSSQITPVHVKWTKNTQHLRPISYSSSFRVCTTLTKATPPHTGVTITWRFGLLQTVSTWPIPTNDVEQCNERIYPAGTEAARPEQVGKPTAPPERSLDGTLCTRYYWRWRLPPLWSLSAQRATAQEQNTEINDLPGSHTQKKNNSRWSLHFSS